MDRKKRSTVIGAALIFIGILTGTLQGCQQSPEGRFPFLRVPQGGISKPEQTTAALPSGPASPGRISFSALDAKKAVIRYADDCGYRVDIAKLVQKELDWTLIGEKPTVLILHTHASESYTKQPGQNYKESSQYRTLDTAFNMVALGDKLTALLEQAGISVIHDRQIHDYPSYNNSYNNSRVSVQDYLKQYPSIQVVLDLHRDAVLLSDGSQYAPTVEVEGKDVAQVMMVVGSDASGMVHPHWQDNLAAALKLQVLMEKAAPGITRPTILRAQRFNHDLSAGAMIVEIGTAGNTFQQAMGAVPVLADAIIGLTYGAKADSTS